MEALETLSSTYKSVASFNHGFVQANLVTELRNRLRATHTIATAINLELNGQQTVSDLAVFAWHTPSMQRDTLWTQKVPLATVEILSFKQDLDLLLCKAKIFLAAGVKSCWIVLPAIGTIAIFTGPTTYRSFTNGSSALDEVLGVEIPLADIFS